MIVLIVLLASCGGKDQGTEADWGLYEGVSCVYAGLDIGADGDWVELKQKGKATVCMMGEEISCKWELDGTAFTLKEGGSEYYGTLSGGQLTLDLDGVVYTFEKKGGAPAASGDKNGDKELGKKDGPVTYKLISFTMEGEEMGPDMVEMMGGGYVVLGGDGTGTFAMFGENFPVTDDGKSIEADGQKMPYTLTDNGMELDMEGSIFVLEVTDEEVPAASAGQTSDEDKGDPSELSYWEGDYYGWWVIDSVWEGEGFEEGDWWDCCATIELDEDGTGTMILWASPSLWMATVWQDSVPKKAGSWMMKWNMPTGCSTPMPPSTATCCTSMASTRTVRMTSGTMYICVHGAPTGPMWQKTSLKICLLTMKRGICL